jgi:hypothetical protein
MPEAPKYPERPSSRAQLPYGEGKGDAEEMRGPGYEEMKRRYEALRKDYDQVRGWDCAV